MEKINEIYNETLNEKRIIYKEGDYRYIRKERESGITKEIKYVGKGAGPDVKVLYNNTFEVKLPEKIISYKDLDLLINNLEQLKTIMKIIGLKDESYPEIKKELDIKEEDSKRINELLKANSLSLIDSVYMRAELTEFRKGLRAKPEWMNWD